MTRLSASEREVIATYNDAEKMWCVYSDSATMRGKILRLARQVGAMVQRVGEHGIEFTCPADALRLTAKRRVRLSDDQRATYQERGRRLTSARRSVRGKTA